MENFQNIIIQHLRVVLREVHWYEATLEDMPYKYVRADHLIQCYTSPQYWEDYYDDECYDSSYFEDYFLGERWGPPLNRPYEREIHKYSNRQYSFKCKSSEDDHWDLYVLTYHIGSCYNWRNLRSGWYLHKCGGIAHNKIFLASDFYDLTAEMLFGKTQEILVILVMEDV